MRKLEICFFDDGETASTSVMLPDLTGKKILACIMVCCQKRRNDRAWVQQWSLTLSSQGD